MLCTRHGIGFILINMDFPEDSKILIHAREKSEIDWNMANRLAEENKDFKNYLSKVDIFCEKPTEAVIESIWYNIDKHAIPKQNKKKNKHIYIWDC